MFFFINSWPFLCHLVEVQDRRSRLWVIQLVFHCYLSEKQTGQSELWRCPASEPQTRQSDLFSYLSVRLTSANTDRCAEFVTHAHTRACTHTNHMPPSALVINESKWRQVEAWEDWVKCVFVYISMCVFPSNTLHSVLNWGAASLTVLNRWLGVCVWKGERRECWVSGSVFGKLMLCYNNMITISDTQEMCSGHEIHVFDCTCLYVCVI